MENIINNNLKDHFFTQLYLLYQNIYKNDIKNISEENIKELIYEFIDLTLIYENDNLSSIINLVSNLYKENNNLSIVDYINQVKNNIFYNEFMEFLNLFYVTSLDEKIGIIKKTTKKNKKIIMNLFSIENMITIIVDYCIISNNNFY